MTRLLVFWTFCAMACAEPAPIREDPVHYPMCDKQSWTLAYVAVDSSGRVLVCAFVPTSSIGIPYRTTPIVQMVADTLFVTALLEKPTPGVSGVYGTGAMMGKEPYRVIYGPLRKGRRLRVTNRVDGKAPGYVPLLDTIVLIR